MWQPSASMYSNREKKTCELASEIVCCDMSSFSLQLNYSVEGCQKELLETSTIYLAWISSQAGVNQCALYLWNKLLFPLCKGRYLGEFASQAVCSPKVAEICRAHSPAGWCCMGCCVPPVWGHTAWWEHQELAQPQLCVCCIPRLVPSWTSWSQMLTFLITGNCCVTLPERNRSTKQWLCTSKLCVCRRAEQWLLSQLLWAFRAVQFRFLFSQAGCALVLVVMDWQQHACFPVPLSWCPLAPSCPSLPGQVLHQDCYHGCDIYSRGGPGS